VKLVPGRHAGAFEAALRRLKDDGVSQRIAAHDASLWGTAPPRAASVRNRLGWLTIASEMLSRTGEIQSLVEDIERAGVRDVVVLGMGGSSLAPAVLGRSIESRRGAPRLSVLDTTDPETIRRLHRSLALESTLFIVASKSGGTIEVAALYGYFRHAMERAVGASRAGSRFVAITDAGTPLERLARDAGFRRIFLNPADIGGRYSALSCFGAVPAAVAGIDIERLLDAGVEAQREALEGGGGSALALGAMIGALSIAGIDKLSLLVGPAVASFGLWLEQLIAESTGKDGVGILPVVAEPPGTPRVYGHDRLWVQFRVEGDSNGEHDALIGALTAEGHPAVIIDLDTAYDLGREFFRWEYATAVAGVLLGINPFDEPNVQESKENTAGVLSQFERSGALDAFDGESGMFWAGDTAQPRDVVGALQSLFGALQPGGYLAICGYITEDERAEAAFSRIRAAVRDELRVATTLGYGPRYLHSTGQLHKGGPASGAFLLVTAHEREDLSIPGRPYTFGQLKRAQAIGDFQSLVARGRPVLRVHLGAAPDRALQALVEATNVALLRLPKR